MLKFLEMLLVSLIATDEKGKVDPYKAAGIAFGMKGGKMTDSDWADLGTTLGAMGAFDDDDTPSI